MKAWLWSSIAIVTVVASIGVVVRLTTTVAVKIVSPVVMQDSATTQSLDEAFQPVETADAPQGRILPLSD